MTFAKLCGDQTHGADLNTLAAADTYGIGIENTFLAAESQDSVGTLDDGNIQRGQCSTHHGAAHQQLVGSFFEAAASVDKLLNGSTDSYFQVLGLADGRTGNGNDSSEYGGR